MNARDFLVLVKEFVQSNPIKVGGWADDVNGNETTAGLPNNTNKLGMDYVEPVRNAVIFSFNGAWFRCEDLAGPKENKGNKLSDEAKEYVYFSRKQFDEPYLTQTTAKPYTGPYRAYGLYSDRVFEDFGVEGLVKMLDRALSLYDGMVKYRPFFKQKLAEVKNKADKTFYIPSTTFVKYGLDDYAGFMMVVDVAIGSGFTVEKEDGQLKFFVKED